MALDARDEGHKQGLEEGREEGHRQGLEEGREEGHRQGRAEGREEGITIGEARAAEKIHKEKLRAALNLRHMGLSDEQIASALGLGAGDLKDLDSKKG
jgi:flagellar biosynthesis/type III secretory pathway protein FliH